MTLPKLLQLTEIKNRLERIFPHGIEIRKNLVREMAAKTVFVFLYGGMLEGSGRTLRPSHIYLFTEEQAQKIDNEDRLEWVAKSKSPGFRPSGVRWYADNTREPIRDETIRFGLLQIGAVGKRTDLAVTSSKPIYYLKADFAAIFDPDLADVDVGELIASWQAKHLTPAARARMVLLRNTRSENVVFVNCPDQTIAKLTPGPSSQISKALVEEFAPLFLNSPALLWLSESGNKVRHQDQMTAKALVLMIDHSRILPDIILADIGESGSDTHLVFVEVVASDGPMNEARRDALRQYVLDAGFPEDQCFYGTAFDDRASQAFRKCVSELAWGTFAWFRSEPERLIWFYSKPFMMGKENATPQE